MDRDRLREENFFYNFKDKAIWFPGHMAKALRKVKEKIKLVDIVLDVRDARVPLTSGNNSILRSLGNKLRLIVLNKADLADKENVKIWKEWFLERKEPFVFINALKTKSLDQIKRLGGQMMKSKWRLLEKKGIKTPPLRMMALGIPNVGKSTIINRLTGRRALRVGDRPGVTRGQEWVVMGKNMELLDTPGIMPPKIETAKQGMWLSAVHAVKDEILGKDKIACYIAACLADKQSSQFRDRYGLESFDANPEELVRKIGEKLNFKKRGGKVDVNKTCALILKNFREGALGSYSFEYPPLSKDDIT